MHSATLTSERELRKAAAAHAAVSRELQEQGAKHEEQRELWDTAMEEAGSVQEALKLQLQPTCANRDGKGSPW